MQSIEHKRGATFKLEINSSDDLTGQVITSQVRDIKKRLISTLEFEAVDANNFTLSCQTNNWEAGEYYCDIRFSLDEEIEPSETLQIIVVEDYTL
ncbi:MAG: hypothetical protein ACWGHH_06420 [Sulfurovaceae bacterium]